MRYIADDLTLFRLIAGPVIVCVIVTNHWQVAAVLFAAGIISDALDGFAARRWPYSKQQEKRLPWRKDPGAWDNLADATLVGCTFVALGISELSWSITVLIVILNIAGSAFFIRTISIQKKKNLKLAKIFDIAFRWAFGGELAILLVWLIVIATDAWAWWLIVLTAAGLILLYAKWDHATFKDDPTYN